MNNVNVQKMEKFVQEIQEDPSQAKKHKQVSGSWIFTEGEPQFVAELPFQGGNLTINVELPPFAGGWGTSPDPIQYCLGGLAACFAVTFAATASGEGMRLSNLNVKAENWMNLQKQMGVGNANIIEKVRFTVSAGGVSDQDLDRLVMLTKERCPGVECITQSVPLEVSKS